MRYEQKAELQDSNKARMYEERKKMSSEKLKTKTKTKQAIDKLNEVIDDYINIFNSDKKEIKEIEQSLKVLMKKTRREI